MARCSFVPELDQLVSMATFPIGKQMAGKIFKNCSWIKCTEEHPRRPPFFFIFQNHKTANMVLRFFQGSSHTSPAYLLYTGKPKYLPDKSSAICMPVMLMSEDKIRVTEVKLKIARTKFLYMYFYR